MNQTRDALHRIATHVLARARFAATGRFGLRAAPGGFATPAFGEAVEVLRVDGDLLVRERAGHSSAIALDGATLADVAAFAGADLAAPFAAGSDTPPIGDPGAPLSVALDDALALADWWHLGWQGLDSVCAGARDAQTIQLWPEHFDAGTSVATGDGPDDRCNLGVSPGDEYRDEPYLYVGPWGSERPGDGAYWNAPFGAAITRGEVLRNPHPRRAAVEFFAEGLRRLG